jgi:hypothetical protein
MLVRTGNSTMAWSALLLSLVFSATASPLAAQPVRIPQSAAYWRDVCAGYRIGIDRADQEKMCLLYLSSFQDATAEYSEAGQRLFCPPETLSTEAVRRIFLTQMTEIAEAAEFVPVGRALVQALMRSYPCVNDAR